MLSRKDNNCISALFALTFRTYQGIQWLYTWNINKQKQKKILSSSKNYIIYPWFLNNTTIITFPLILRWHNEVTSRNIGWFFMMTEERTESTGWCERSLWSKTAKFVFLPLIITKHLTPLMNSFSWIMGVENAKQEIARWRDRLSLSKQLTAELELHQWSSSKSRNDTHTQKKYNGFLCTFSSVLDSGPDTSSVWKTGTEHRCLWGDESFAVLHTGKWHVRTPGIFHQASSFLSFLSLEEENQLNLEPLTFALKDEN